MHQAVDQERHPEPAATALRPADQVMRLARLGRLHQSRLSFVRSLVRQMIRERWRIERERFELDAEGFGDALYRIATPGGEFRFVVFSQELDPVLRSDRVIAEQWDLACALCVGELTETQLDELRANVPRQEAGRYTSRVLTLSRANRRQRNFDSVVERLAAGQQPDVEWFEQVGYLYRTTAVYGNGKFGLADYERLRQDPTFARPFSAQMLTVYLVRHFSLEQVEHIARQRAPTTAVSMARAFKRYLGIGNSTGLGMAPFLVNHPQLIDRWVHTREIAIARVLAWGPVTTQRLARLIALTDRCREHFAETHTADAKQAASNQHLRRELVALRRWLALQRYRLARTGSESASWRPLIRLAARRWSLETQELINSLLLELHPDLVDELEDSMSVEEGPTLRARMPLAVLRRLIETRYGWALAYDFTDPEEQRLFWYRSVEKEEPRLGERGRDPGDEREMALDIAREVSRCYDAMCTHIDTDLDADVVDFLLAAPEHRGVVRRIQNIASLAYGEIRANLLGRDCVPIHLLRCKLSFFGASKFDPRSDRWVRITLFQGAPLVDELDTANEDIDWFLPTRPTPEQ